MPDVVTIRNSHFSKDLEAVAWEDIPTEVIKREQQCWNFDPKSKWHGYAGYAKGYAMVDPNKLTLLTPGIDRADRRLSELRSACHSGGELSPRTARCSGKVRPEQHPVPDDASGRREQAQHPHCEARQFQKSVG